MADRITTVLESDYVFGLESVSTFKWPPGRRVQACPLHHVSQDSEAFTTGLWVQEADE